MIRTRNDNGVTFIETIVAIFVLVLLTLAIGEMTIATIRLTSRQSELSETQRAAGIGIEPIREAAEGANTILATQTINGTLYTTSSSTVVFDIPAIDASGNLVSGSHDYVAFTRSAVDNTVLVRATQAAAGSVRISRTDTITPFVSALHFRYNTSTPVDATTVEVFLETSRTVQGATERTPIGALIRLQNK